MNNYLELQKHLYKLKYKVHERNKKFIKRNFYFNNTKHELKRILSSKYFTKCDCSKKIDNLNYTEENYKLINVDFIINSIIGSSINNKLLKSSDDTGLRICYIYENKIIEIPIFFGINKSIKKCKGNKNKGCFYLNINDNQNDNYVSTRLSNIIKNLKLHNIINNSIIFKFNNYVKPTLEYYKCFNLSKKKCNKKHNCKWKQNLYGLREGKCSFIGNILPRTRRNTRRLSEPTLSLPRTRRNTRRLSEPTLSLPRTISNKSNDKSESLFEYNNNRLLPQSNNEISVNEINNNSFDTL